MTDLIEDALVNWYGPRCEDYDPDCCCCCAWKQFDDLKEKASD